MNNEFDKGFLVGILAGVVACAISALIITNKCINDHQKQMVEYGIGQWSMNTNTMPPDVKFHYIRKNP